MNNEKWILTILVIEFIGQTLRFLSLNFAGVHLILISISMSHHDIKQAIPRTISPEFEQFTNKNGGLKLIYHFQNQVIANQLKRQSDDLLRLRGSLDRKTESENRLEKQVRESKRHYADLESKMKEEIMMARIRDAENTQRVAELTQKISGLECKVGCRL